MSRFNISDTLSATNNVLQQFQGMTIALSVRQRNMSSSIMPAVPGYDFGSCMIQQFINIYCLFPSVTVAPFKITNERRLNRSKITGQGNSLFQSAQSNSCRTHAVTLMAANIRGHNSWLSTVSVAHTLHDNGPLHDNCDERKSGTQNNTVPFGRGGEMVLRFEVLSVRQMATGRSSLVSLSM